MADDSTSYMSEFEPDEKTDEDIDRDVSKAISRHKFRSMAGFFTSPAFFVLLVVAVIGGVIYMYPGIIDPVLGLFGDDERQADDGPDEPQTVTKTVEYNITVNETVEKNISFERYLADPQDYVYENISLTGFLRDELKKKPEMVDVLVHHRYIVDDYGNKIELVNVDAQQDNNFLMGRTTFYLYNVTGVFADAYKGIKIKVRNITAGQRQTEFIQKTETRTKTVEVALEPENGSYTPSTVP